MSDPRTRPAALSDNALEKRIGDLPGWSIRAGKLYRKFEFDDFVAAFGFMTRAALVAEKMDHHPEWSNVYARVEVELTTHDAGGITELDFTLAAEMDRLAS